MSHESESKLENNFINDLIKMGYERIHLKNYDSLIKNFKIQFEKFNKSALKGVPLTKSEWGKILHYISVDNAYQASLIFRDKYALERDDGSVAYLAFFDREPEKNIFQIANQVPVSGKYKNRYDVVLFLNGLPVYLFELKKRGNSIKEAFNQIRRYKRHSIKGLFHFVELFIISNGLDTKYFANNDKELLYAKTFYWTNEDNIRTNNLKEFSDVFLTRKNVLEMLYRYIRINKTDECLLALASHQINAIKKVLENVSAWEGNGYIYHTTGSGKTLTAFTMAQIIAEIPDISKVIFLSDRKDLDIQTVEEFNKFSSGSIDFTDNSSALVEQMNRKDSRVIITTMQKMAHALRNEKYSKKLMPYENEKTVFIIDECHRSQFGSMHRSLVRHFKNAMLIGLTGTPRYKENAEKQGEIKQTTDLLFGKCLHKYAIEDGIHDNNVLPLRVIYKNTITGKYDPDDRTLAYGIDTDEIYRSDERINAVATGIIRNHNVLTRNRQYCSILTVESIEMLFKYYDAFKRINHDLKIAGICSIKGNGNAESDDGSFEPGFALEEMDKMIADYNLVFDRDFSVHSFEAYRRDISNRMKGNIGPGLDILIVVNMFLTGFDSKKLGVLYVDKHLEYHNLIQAYSRTNRIEKETKPFGIIVNYRNLKQETDTAFALYSRTGSPEKVLMPDFDYFVEGFNGKYIHLKSIAPKPESLNTIKNEEKQKEFVDAFQELTKTLNSLKFFIEYEDQKKRLKISEQEYLDYRSKYLEIYLNRKSTYEKTSVLDDVDFHIELMEEDAITVSYIEDRLKYIDDLPLSEKKREIDRFKEELKKMKANPLLRKKVELLIEFLEKLEEGLAGSGFSMSFEEFKETSREKEIKEFSKKMHLDSEKLKFFINEVSFSGVLNKEELIKDCIKEPLTFLKKEKVLEKILHFIDEIQKKYGG